MITIKKLPITCERGVSKMNKIKSKFLNQLSLSLSLKNRSLLLCFRALILENKTKFVGVMWDECFEAWKDMKKNTSFGFHNILLFNEYAKDIWVFRNNIFL